jgi:potassium voltage-gated channel Eag-related subfamily H protein 8
MFKHLPTEVLGTILSLFNKISRTGGLPSGWKRAVDLPFVKPGKDSSCPARYRPIALTSNLCKLVEQVIVGILVYYLEH